MISLHKFNSDPYMFFRYCTASLIVIVLADIFLFFYGNGSTHLNFAPQYLLFLILGIAFGVLSAVFIHNATHRSFKPLWLNRIIGEFCGLHQLYGFMGWSIAHIIHHKYPDDPMRDPHAPGTMPFWIFARNMHKSLRNCLTRIYFEKHEHTNKINFMFTLKDYAGTMGILFRLLFWFLLLGPNIFIWFYIPSMISNTLFFTHLNYSSHRPQNDKTIEILDLNHNLYYKVVNFLFFGIYFHKSHHKNPNLFNPQIKSK